MAEETERNTWQNSLPYLQLIAELEQSIVLHLVNSELLDAIKKCRILLSMLERHVGRRKGERKQEYTLILDKIVRAKDQARKMKNLAGLRESKLKATNELEELITEIFEDLGLLMYDNDLVFKKGVAAGDIWALG